MGTTLHSNTVRRILRMAKKHPVKEIAEQTGLHPNRIRRVLEDHGVEAVRGYYAPLADWAKVMRKVRLVGVSATAQLLGVSRQAIYKRMKEEQ